MNINLHDIDKVIQIIAAFDRCEVDDIISDKRNAELVSCRGIIVLLLRELYDLNFRQIGEKINRNKSTVSKSYKQYSYLCDIDKNIKIKYIKLTNKLKHEGLL